MSTAVSIVGLGVIGGSLAQALRDDPAWRVTGFAIDRADAEAASRAGIATAATLDEAGAAGADGIIVIAVPLDRIASVAGAVLASAPDALVLHTGSLQRAESVRLDAPHRDRVFGTHPVAGSHGTGFGAARGDIFRDATVSIERRLDGSARERAATLWRAAGATRLEIRDAEEHDALMAWASHLPQLCATALASALVASGTPVSTCGPGARGATRLAQSSFAMWRPMLERAPAETLVALRALREELAMLEQRLVERDLDALAETWERARAWRSQSTAVA